MQKSQTPAPPPDPYEPIRKAIQAGEAEAARAMLRPLLAFEPTAEAWYLAAQVAAKPEQAINFLRRAIALEPLHSGANRLLLKLEGPKPSIANLPSLIPVDVPTGPLERNLHRTSADRHKERQRGLSRIITVFMLLLSLSCSVFALNAVGVYQGLMTGMNYLTGGPTPVSEIEGTPLAQLDHAAALVPAAQSKPATQRDADILENGYLNEYLFEGRSAQQVAIYVQFMSLQAQRVSHNLAILDPNGSDIYPQCRHDAILKGDNNVALTCDLNLSGTYRVRVLGRSGESVGAYFVGVQKLQ